MTFFQKFLNALLRVQSVLSAPQSLLSSRRIRAEHPDDTKFIFGQGALAGHRLYAAKADLTACEVIAVYNALIYLGSSKRFETVRCEFLRRGSLTLGFVGFFGGNPYSIKRVLKNFDVAHEPVLPDEMNRDGGYIISFFNGKHPSLHTIFCTRTDGKWLGYNIHSNDRRPMPFDPQKLTAQFIRGYRLEDIHK